MKIYVVQVLLLLALATANDEEPEDNEFLYLDADENEPVIEFLPAMRGNPSQGDFRESMKPKMVEFYNPFCVSKKG